MRFADALLFAGDFRVLPLDFEDAAVVFRAVGFFFPALEPVERLFERLLGFLGVAMATHYS